MEPEEQITTPATARTWRPRLGYPGGHWPLQISHARLAAHVLFDSAGLMMKGLRRHGGYAWAANALNDELSAGFWFRLPSLKAAVEGFGDENLIAEAKAAAQRLERAGRHPARLGGPGPGQHVYWMEARGREGKILFRSAPLKAGESLAQELYPRFTRAVVLTSSRPGPRTPGPGLRPPAPGACPEETQELVLGSPFDCFKQVEAPTSSRLVPDPRQG